jgi:hypothetical protein
VSGETVEIAVRRRVVDATYLADDPRDDTAAVRCG